MSRFQISRLYAALVLAFPITALAQAPASNAPETPTVVVTGNPLGSQLFDLSTPVSLLSGQNLLLQSQSTLGETLAKLPGISASYFGPNASRPVIRGLDADRVKIMQDGIEMFDLSALSPDHATTVDPLVIDRIEVVRGAATLLYGGSAIGGVVNVIDNRIPETAINGVNGRFQMKTGSVDDERSGSLVLEGGNGKFAFHVDANSRRNENLEINGFARSDRQRLLDDPTQAQPNGTLPNSHGKASGGAAGASVTFDSGYLGLSYSSFDALYGVVAEPDVTIDMNSETWNLAGELRTDKGLIESIKFKHGNTDYQHVELDAGAPGTLFASKGSETRVEALHQKIGGFRGAIGVQFSDNEVSAIGAEALLPRVETSGRAVFFFEQTEIGNLTLNFGGRIDKTELKSAGGGPIDPSTLLPRFDPAQTRSFSARSTALGAIYKLSANYALAANIAHTERAPSYTELYANGPHVATGQYEVGNAAFAKERSNGVDMQLRWRSGAHSASVGAFHSRFGNYLIARNSGNMRGADGELNPDDLDGDGVADVSGEELLPEAAFGAVRAKHRGFEAEAKFRLMDAATRLDLNLRGDYVRANNSDTGEALPRIMPLRLGGGLEWTVGAINARIDAHHAFKQNRVSANELPTDAYTVVDASVIYNFGGPRFKLEAFGKVSNMFDAEVHSSILKDIAPLPGRGLVVGIRGRF
jgi:iron complex outermembrane recepter protein